MDPAATLSIITVRGDPECGGLAVRGFQDAGPGAESEVALEPVPLLPSVFQHEAVAKVVVGDVVEDVHGVATVEGHATAVEGDD